MSKHMREKKKQSDLSCKMLNLRILSTRVAAGPNFIAKSERTKLDPKHKKIIRENKV